MKRSWQTKLDGVAQKYMAKVCHVLRIEEGYEKWTGGPALGQHWAEQRTFLGNQEEEEE